MSWENAAKQLSQAQVYANMPDTDDEWVGESDKFVFSRHFRQLDSRTIVEGAFFRFLLVVIKIIFFIFSIENKMVLEQKRCITSNHDASLPAQFLIFPDQPWWQS